MSLNYELLRDSLINWYSIHPEYFSMIDAINNHKKLITTDESGHQTEQQLPSLRQIDYCVVNYSKLHRSNYRIRDCPFEIHQEYKNQLMAYSKDYFDPFRRGQKIVVGNISTALCQLNFFRWAIPNGVIDFTISHCSDIEQEMSTTIGNRKRENLRGMKRKKTLNPKNEYQCVMYNVSSKVTMKSFPAINKI